MEKRIHLYTTRNVMGWLMVISLLSSAVIRIIFPGFQGGTTHVWTQVVLPCAACLLYALIAFVFGKEMFYKTAIPVWMIAIYFGFAVANNQNLGKMYTGLYWAVLVFWAVIYTQISCGKERHLLLLPLLLAAPAPILCYFSSEPLMAQDWAPLLKSGFVSNILMLLGMIFQCLNLKIHPADEYHPTWGDRSDGRRVRTLPPISQVSPYIMVHRNESSNLFEESFEITNIDRYIRKKRKEGLTSFGLMHVFLAAYCRGLCRYPALNRFLSGQKVYSRGKDIQFCITVKKEMTVDAPDTVIKVHLSPTDTADDVYRKVQAQVENAKNTPLDSGMDNTAQIFTLIPGLFLKFVVWLLKLLDYFGLLPGFLLEVSPFHGSLFFTSMGSLGIPPIYHHLYDFGNLPVFGAFGCKRRATEILEDGTLVTRKYVDFKFVLDERIADGYYYAAFFKHYKRILFRPEVLDTVPEEVQSDID